MKRGKKSNKIIIDFIGNEREDVTGSSVKIEYPKGNGEYGNILIELGLTQTSSTFDKDISANRKMLDRLSKDMIGKIDYVLLSHQHVDHVGNLSYLCDSNGFKGKILGTKMCIEVAKELIEDTVNIHIKNIEKLKSLGKKTRPLYSKQDMFSMFDNMQSVDSYKKIKLNDFVTIEFVNAGHCVGSSMIKLWIKRPNGSIFHAIYTGDCGSEYNKIVHPLADKREQISKCNLLISEATYCCKERSFNKSDVIREFEDFKSTIKQSILEGKRILLPVFSFNKTQEFLILLHQWLKDEEWFGDTPVVVDGLLMHKVSDVFKRELNDEKKDMFLEALSWKNVQTNKTYDGTLAILTQRTSGIYLASSGFCQNGRVVTYLKQFLGCSKDVVLFTGFIGGEGSIGYRIANPNQRTVTIEKETIMKRCEIKQYHCFSSHIQYDELLSIYKGVQVSDKILIHHCSKQDKDSFVKEAKSYSNKKIEAVTNKNNQFVF